MERHLEEMLPCALKDYELQERGQELAALQERREQIEQAKKDAMAGFREELKDIEQRAKAIAKEVRDKAEERMVKVFERFDFDRGVVITMRTDTGEVLRTRTMTSAERQLEFDTGAGIPDADPGEPAATH